MERMLAEVIASEMSYTEATFRKFGRFHPRRVCRANKAQGGPTKCVIHNPSRHKMTGWPKVVRATTLIERTCPHGVGHPDPDSVAYMNWATKQKSWGVHGCDGCCSEPKDG